VVRDRTSLYVAVFSIAFATLGLELLQTRVLSALFWNHVVYLTVTVALMGFGISGVFVSLVARRVAQPDRWAAICLGGFAVSSFVSLRFASHVPAIYPVGEAVVGALLQLLLCYGVLVIPFLFSGTALGLLFMAHARRIDRLYFTDLTASALGAVAFTALLRPLGGDLFAWLIGFTALAGFLVYARRAGLTPATTLWVAGLFCMGFFCTHRHLLGNQPEAYKTSYLAYNPYAPMKVEHSEWTPLTKLDVVSNVHGQYRWGPGDAKKDGIIRLITQDGTAHTPMFGPDFVEDMLRQGQPGQPVHGSNLVYLARPAPEDALVIGVGGGVDVVGARALGARRITGVEINAATIDMVQGPYCPFVQWPGWEGVNLVCAEGRHFCRSTAQQYDTIVMAGIDTFSALSSGAYVLSENYLYTVEAVEDYLKCLKPGGMMSVSRWLFYQPRESLRLANLYLYAAERAGVERPSRCIMVLSFPGPEDQFRWSTIIFKKQPFTPAEVKAVLDRVRAQPELAAVYVPDVFPEAEQRALEAATFAHDAEYLGPARTAFGRMIRSGTDQRRLFEQEYYYNITPVYDDRPFFFEYHKLFQSARGEELNRLELRGTLVHYTLYLLLLVTGVVAFCAMILPLYRFQREGLRVPGVGALLAFFSSLGVGFMFIEMGLIQRLNVYLGHPMYSLSIVLAGLLFVAGVGSYCSGRLPLTPGRLLAVGMLGTSLSALAWVAVMDWVIPATLQRPLAVRVTLTLASLTPVGLLMGIPFATGLKLLEKQQRFIPWVWGINGLTSVMASVLAIIVAMRGGFQLVLLLGAVTYLLGWLAVRRYLAGLQAAVPDSPFRALAYEPAVTQAPETVA
jgi:hypothetical protein